jgi:hypothetical protein
MDSNLAQEDTDPVFSFQPIPSIDMNPSPPREVTVASSTITEPAITFAMPDVIAPELVPAHIAKAYQRGKTDMHDKIYSTLDEMISQQYRDGYNHAIKSVLERCTSPLD